MKDGLTTFGHCCIFFACAAIAIESIQRHELAHLSLVGIVLTTYMRTIVLDKKVDR